MKRLFAFGCSYTSYSWPTWANLISADYDESYNWGLAGIGNRAIAERVAEAHARYTFTKDDVIIVQWSSHLRNDFYHQFSLPKRSAGWKTAGSVFNYINAELYDKEWIDTFFFEPAYMMHTLNHITMTQCMLESTGCKWFMTSIGDIRNMGSDLRQGAGYGEVPTIELQPGGKFLWEAIPEITLYDKPIWGKYADHWLMPMELYCQTCQDQTYSFIDTNNTSQEFLDIHPSPRQHLGWVKQELADKLELSDEAIALAEQVANAVDQIHKQMRFNKEVFNLSVVKTQWPTTENKRIVWPGAKEGF